MSMHPTYIRRRRMLALPSCLWAAACASVQTPSIAMPAADGQLALPMQQRKESWLDERAQYGSTNQDWVRPCA